MRVPVTYEPAFIAHADTAFMTLRDELQWERRDDAPRCEYYCNDVPKPYVYGQGRGRRQYEPQRWHPLIVQIRMWVETKVATRFEVCFLNRYLDQSDHLGWHADDSPEMDDKRPIAIVSLGVEREIWFRPKPTEGIRGYASEVVMLDQGPNGELQPSIEKLKLGHGSLCLMAPGMQDEWQHRIPKASFHCGERISLTFRGYVP